MKVSTESEELFFDPIKEHRGWYFVVHNPPRPGHEQFAVVQIVVLDGPRSKEEVASAMESELETWTSRYPVPMMVTAFDESDSIVPLEPARPCDHLFGWPSAGQGLERHWRLVENREIPTSALDHNSLRRMYEGVPFRTREQNIASAKASARRMRLGKWIIVGWVVGVPLLIMLLEWWSVWLGTVMLLYAVWKAYEKALKMLGRWPKSKAERDREADELRMRHYHYHCENNPEGFLRLKAENFERWAREDTHAEAARVKGENGG
jgi:hypothetical protein